MPRLGKTANDSRTLTRNGQSELSPIPGSAPFETFVPGAATSMPHVREAEANLPETDARPPDAVIDDAAGRATGSDAQKADPVNLRTIVLLRDVNGPLLPFSPRPIAAVQLHQTGHSSIAQHFWRMKVGRADIAADQEVQPKVSFLSPTTNPAL